MDTLDNILSGQGDAVSEQAATTEEVTQAATEGQLAGEEQQTGAEGQEGQEQRQAMVPHEALHAEKQKVKRYTEEVSGFRRTNEALQRQVAELLQRVPIPKKEEAAKHDWFENPDAATQQVVQQSVDPQFQRLYQTMHANAQLIASVKYGDEKVAAADQAFMEAVQSGKLDPVEYQRVTTAPNIFAAAVQWHQRQLAQAEIGDDPTAYRAKVEAEILAKYGIQPGTQQQAQPGNPAAPVVMPSNIAGARNVGSRSGPAWSGPPSLQDIFARK